ncbi:MAG: hypothetical protein OEY29_04250 [Gammaproteobacteria bacterium]|nr:hypothetical protein [Gammaproteobacteria bacterium]
MSANDFRSAAACVICLCMIPAASSVAEGGFAEWMQQQQTEYQEYKDLRDKEFTSFLQSHWKELDVDRGIKRDPAPKPVVMPVAKPKPKPVVQKPPVPVADPVTPRPDPEKTPLQTQRPEQPVIPKVIVETPPAIVVKPVEIKTPPAIAKKPVVLPVVVNAPKGRAAKIHYYGRDLLFYYDPKLKAQMRGAINENTISNFWSDLSKADYDGLIEQLKKQREPLQLNDWSYALLVNELAKSIYTGQKNEQSLFTWFLLVKTSYQARLAYSDNKVFLLLPTEQPLYGVAYFTFSGKRYYALAMDGNKAKPGKVFTYDGQYPGAENSLDMSVNRSLNTGASKKSRQVSFTYDHKRYKVMLGYDQNTIDFLSTYPQMDIDQYFKSRVNAEIGNPVLRQLKDIVAGKSEEEAVNIILLFVQNAFKYKTDQGQFGEENYLFPEETLYYPYSDCEDRSVVFAWLVRSLIGLEVVGLDFPGHIAAAVEFKANVNGDKVRHNGKTYVVTDPTYINATAGMTMPEYKKVKPKVISFRAF